MANFKIGDRIRIVNPGDCGRFYGAGDIAVLERRDDDKDWWARFESSGKSWCIGNNDPKRNLTRFEHFVPFVPPAPSILIKAHELVNGDRAKSYGDCHTNFQRWSDLLRPLDIHLSPYQLALVMVAGKLARQAHAPKEDNLVDAAGYLEIAHKLAPK